MTDILRALLFFVPAAAANASPVFANKIPGLNRWTTPIDLGKTYRGRRILGDNKTWRGLLSGTVIGALTAILIYVLDPSLLSHFVGVTFTPLIDTAILGAALGFGALIGDVVESFFKRRRKVPAGNSWFPFDQIDYILGGLLFIWPLTWITFGQAISICIAFFGLHIIGSYIGYLLKLKDKPI